MPGLSANLDNRRTMAYCACRRSDAVCKDFFVIRFISVFFSYLYLDFYGSLKQYFCHYRTDSDRNTVSKSRKNQNNQPNITYEEPRRINISLRLNPQLSWGEAGLDGYFP